MSTLPFSALAVATAALLLSPLANGQAVISEFLADNRSGITDSDSEASDWIEIFNDSTSPVDLEGWSLTDRVDEPTRWIFPAVTMAPGEFLIVFASGKDRSNPAMELHTNFGLSNSGEYLALIEPDGTVASEFNFPAQMEDVAYGRSGSVQFDVVLPEFAPCKWIVPTGPIPDWETPEFNDFPWSSGTTGIGYDTGTDYNTLIETDIETQMFNVNGSAYIRVPFNLTDTAEILNLTLNLRFDDGFVAYINGVQLTSRNLTGTPVWNSGANNANLDPDALQKEPFDASSALPSLVDGQNTLAIQLLNFNLNSSDLLMMPEIVATRPDAAGADASGFLLDPTPGLRNNNTISGFVADTKFSLKRGFYNSPIAVEITSATDEAIIRYTTDGSAPTETDGTIYTGAVPISTTTILRAIAYKNDYEPTNVDTQTYLFPAEIKSSPDMDPEIVTAAAYANSIESDLSNNLPTMSLVVEDADFFGANGIYSNPDASGRGAEVPLSVEYFNPMNATEEFQIDAGVRIHGGNARSHPKKPMRLYFRGEYGDRRLNFPLFDGSPVESFDQLILRGGGHDSWSLASDFGRDPDEDLPPHGLIMRDQFLRATETEMGLLSPRGRYIHLYINGRYWGVYDIHERANAAYFESYLGGTEDQYDVLHHPEFFGDDYAVVDGNGAAWEAARAIAAGGVTTASEYAAIQEYLDIDNLIDHLIVRMWSGDYDWCGPISQPGGDRTVFSSKNWYTGRRSRGGESSKFHFFCWDAEMSMGNHLMFNFFFPDTPPDQRVVDLDLTGASDSGSPVQFYAALRSYPEFRQRFGDRLHKHFFNDGVMSSTKNRTRWDRQWQKLRNPMVGESARWGDEGLIVDAPFNRNSTWLGEVFWVRNTYIAQRNNIVLDQSRNRNLFPDTEAPSFSQFGGSVPAGFDLSMTSAGNQIYYTTDGSDPYLLPDVQAITLLPEITPTRALVPSTTNGGSSLTISQWTNVTSPPNIASWLSGNTGIGYETNGTNYQPLINLDVTSASGVNASVYARVLFTVPPGTNVNAFSELTLSMKYDDGFVAYLNGARIASANNPTTPLWNSPAVDNRPDTQAEIYQNFDITAFRNRLVVGENMLAIHALNDGAGSSDLLCSPRINATIITAGGGPSSSAMLYTGSLDLEATSMVRARAASPGGEWSALTEATFLVGTLASSSNIVISEFNYRPLPPSTPAELAVANGRTDFEFIEIKNISGAAVDLTQSSFSQGIDFEFSFGSPITLLQPGEYALLVEDADAFAARYGSQAAARIAGEFANDSKLSNDGESVTMLAANGNTIKSFTYSNLAPWPSAADGEGFTLELITPDSNPNHNLATSWQASTDIGGTPAGFTIPEGGYASWAATAFDALPGADTSPEADADGDGWSNLAEFTLASSPADGSSVPSVEVFVTDVAGVDHLAMRYTVSALATDITVTGQTSNDLTVWTEDTIEVTAPTDDGMGNQIHTRRATAPLETDPQQLRLSLTLAP